MISGLLFSPYRGSGYTLLLTSVVSTVPGTVALNHPAVLKPGAATSAPDCATLAAYCICHPDDRTIAWLGAGFVVAETAAVTAIMAVIIEKNKRPKCVFNGLVLVSLLTGSTS